MLIVEIMAIMAVVLLTLIVFGLGFLIIKLNEIHETRMSDLLDRLMAGSFKEYHDHKIKMTQPEEKEPKIIRDDLYEYAVSQGIDPTPENLAKIRAALGSEPGL